MEKIPPERASRSGTGREASTPQTDSNPLKFRRLAKEAHGKARVITTKCFVRHHFPQHEMRRKQSEKKQNLLYFPPLPCATPEVRGDPLTSANPTLSLPRGTLSTYWHLLLWHFFQTSSRRQALFEPRPWHQPLASLFSSLSSQPHHPLRLRHFPQTVAPSLRAWHPLRSPGHIFPSPGTFSQHSTPPSNALHISPTLDTSFHPWHFLPTSSSP